MPTKEVMSKDLENGTEMVPMEVATSIQDIGTSPSSGQKYAVAGASAEVPETALTTGLKLAACFVGLQVSYVTWGVLQEFTMTRKYATEPDPSRMGTSDEGMFPSAVFLVWGNRLTAMLVASLVMLYKTKNNLLQSHAPFWKYAPSSISNCISSWAQYSALKYVSFPTQTLFKSSKIIPVMIVGKILNGRVYEWIEYVEAVFITSGIATFMMAKGDKKHADDEDKNASMETFGIMILCVYVIADSLTSQWQSRVFKQHKVDQFQMMFGVNFFSILFTSISLLQTGSLFVCSKFIFANPEALMHVAVLSFTSATGQLFIFYTIKKFGPIIFTIIMTTRQMFSLVLSCMIYGHKLGFMSIVGAFIVFCTLAERSHRNYANSKRGSK
jgi:adenosine 3'-phospho 5'-phosphosulfate transporter B2